ncbi:MAG: hypothetical protein RLZZ385_2642 [Pseudomonadota bacterium]|jgi:putative iron-regulated protein
MDNLSRWLHRLLGGTLILSLLACDNTPANDRQNPAPAESGETPRSFEQPLLADAVISDLTTAYIDQAIVAYRVAVASAENLQEAVDRLLDAPGEQTLVAARQAWLQAHDDYAATSLHQYFLQALVSGNNSGLGIDLSLERLHYQLDHWPILAGYIDYLDGYPDSGLVSDITVPLSRESISLQHGAFDLAEALLGFHPVEFLLWGEVRPGASGQRPYTDYMEDTELTAEQAAEGLQLTQMTSNRRRQLLDLVTVSLLQDVQAMQQLWTRNRNTLRDMAEGLTGPRQLALLLDAMTAVVTEELMVKSLSPLLNGDHESSLHSPYSQSSAAAVLAQLGGLEQALMVAADAAVTLEVLLTELYPDFSQTFYQNFDAGKECLERLYASVNQSGDPEIAMTIEAEIVECINFMGNLTNTLELVKSQFP